MAADCKSAALTCYGGSNPSLPTISFRGAEGNGELNSHASGNPVAGFPEPLRAFRGTGETKGTGNTRKVQGVSRAHVAQSVEHVLGKDGVSSSILLVGSSYMHQGNPGPGFPRTPSTAEGNNHRGSNSGVESQPSKLLVAGSNPVSRSSFGIAGRAASVRLSRSHHHGIQLH